MQGSYVKADPGPKLSPPNRKAFLKDVEVRLKNNTQCYVKKDKWILSVLVLIYDI